MRFVIVTGMSGAGKSTTLKFLEDIGYYCVHNLPIPLIENFAEHISSNKTETDCVAVGIDVRTDHSFEEFSTIYEMLQEIGIPVEIVYLESDDDVLIKRYKESRRNHPLALTDRVEVGIQREREMLSTLKKRADYIFDTSHMLTRDLKAELDKLFVKNQSHKNLFVTFTSFGFKYGIPADADLVFDVRFLPNPYYYEDMRPLSGNDQKVKEYVLSFIEAEIFLTKLEEMLTFLLPNYILEGKNQLVVAIGCTGGKHRSVTLTNAIYDRMKCHEEYGFGIDHRDIDKDSKRKA